MVEAKFEQFVRERRYLKNVSPKTEIWYRQAFAHLQNPNPSEADLKHCIIRMREAGLKPVSCNSYITAINAYLKWSGSGLKLTKLKEPKRELPMFEPDDILTVLRWKARKFGQRRAQLLILMLADTGTRISELLTLTWEKVNFDDLLVSVVGKGDKERTIPFSYELRRFLHHWKEQSGVDLVFGTRTGTMLTPRNAYRSVKWHCDRLGIKTPARMLHSIRHLFATTFLRRGGNLFALQRTLGHTSLAMVRRYTHLNTDDLQAVHEKLTLLHR